MTADRALPWLESHGQELVEFRRALHRHPELGNAETVTTAAIRARLEEAGLTCTPLNVATGLVCDIGSGDGPLIVLRADIDALPLDDAKDVTYRSQVDGVTHACGHDAHTSIVLAAGLILAEIDAVRPLPGTVRLIFQPAEEIMPGGALSVISSGSLDGAALAFACHCDPTVTTGAIAVKVGPITSSADSIEVVLTGPGGHTARPYRTVDLISALAAVASEVPAALRSLLDTRVGVSLVWGMINAGRVSNAIPQRGVLHGTVRMLDLTAWQQVPAHVERLVAGVAGLYGATASVTYRRGVPPVVNEARAVSLLAHAASSVLGPDGVQPTPQSLGGEDFGWMLEKVPGAMFRLGVRPPGWVGPDLDLHQGSFDIDEDALAIGVRVFVRTALDALDVD